MNIFRHTDPTDPEDSTLLEVHQPSRTFTSCEVEDMMNMVKHILVDGLPIVGYTISEKLLWYQVEVSYDDFTDGDPATSQTYETWYFYKEHQPATSAPGAIGSVEPPAW